MSDLAQWIAYQRRAAVFGTSEETVLALLDVAEAAGETARLTGVIARLNDSDCTDGEDDPCPRCDALGEADKAMTAAEERLSSALARLAEVKS